MKPETEAILMAGWYAKLALDKRPELEAQLTALLREIWECAQIAEGVSSDELLDSAMKRDRPKQWQQMRII